MIKAVSKAILRQPFVMFEALFRQSPVKAFSYVRINLKCLAERFDL